jgi:lysophospholipase L1-like esterase
MDIRKKSLVLRCIAAVVVFCVACEVLVRVYERFTTETGSLYDEVVFSETKRFKLRPNRITRVPERYGDIVYSINEEGYRDRTHSKDMRKTILWLGDSVSFGLGVQQSKIFPSRLQVNLQEKFPGEFKIINLAMFAYNTGDELKAFREDGTKHEPRLVALQFYMNDFAMSVVNNKPTFAQRAHATMNLFVYRSALYRKISQMKERILYLAIHDLRRKYFSGTLNRDEPSSKLNYLKTQQFDENIEAFQVIKEIRSAAEDAGAKFWLMISPDEVQLFDSQYDEINARIMKFCLRENLACFDPLNSLRSRKDARLLYNDGVHFSEKGHEVIASLIMKDFEQRGLLKFNDQ